MWQYIVSHLYYNHCELPLVVVQHLCAASLLQLTYGKNPHYMKWICFHLQFFKDIGLGRGILYKLSAFLLNSFSVFIVFIFHRGEKAFCSAECRCKQILTDEHKEKRRSRVKKSHEYSVSPCSGPMQFFAGVAAAWKHLSFTIIYKMKE